MTRWVLNAFLCISLVACGGNRKKVIGVVPKATSHLFWVSIQIGAKAAGRDLGVDILWNGPATETDYSRQIEIVDSMIARHVDGLAVAVGAGEGADGEGGGQGIAEAAIGLL